LAELTPEVRALIEEPNLAHFVTLMKDGSPQVTPLWVDCDDQHILVNTAEGRQKPLNLARDPRVALSIVDRENPYTYVQVRGRVVEITREGAFEHICKLSEKYTGSANYPQRDGETRIIVRIQPEHIQTRIRPRS
jgi:PPOX class probable F420-dependent enzyme